MGTSKCEQLPPDQMRGQSRFQAWRGSAEAGGRMLQALWARAVRLVRTHGVSRAAAVLSLD